jgi:hypothetical protein
MAQSIANFTASLEKGALVHRNPSGHIIDVLAPRGILWTPPLVPSGVFTVAGVNSGVFSGGSVTTGAADNDDVEVASELVFDIDNGFTAEALVANGDVDKTAVNFGISDAQGESVDKLAATYATATMTTNATDGALFVHDADATTDYWRAVTVNNDTDSTILSSGTAPVDSTEYKLRLDVDADGNATFRVNDVLVGTADQALRATVSYCLYLGYINREAAANSLTVKYLAGWEWSR